MDEKERQYYNKKLIIQGLKNELKGAPKISLRELVLTLIGSFIGMAVIDGIGIDGLINNRVAVFLTEAVIIALSIHIVYLIGGKIIPRKNKDISDD
jgi:hypothetical protein